MKNRIETSDWRADGNTYIEQGYVLIEEDGKDYWILGVDKWFMI